ncbi:MAG: hypothetical protein LBQ37_04480 [Elusimicrobiota bacterium]|jgi:raffinose/stachyose/melibiose transport system permease protein|nr:hypothetical protein [Elusimicrobiota bacterium]
MRKSLFKFYPAFVFLAFAFVLTAVFLPFVLGICLSFLEFTSIENINFAGINNYRAIFSDEKFIDSFLFGVKISAISVISVNVISFVFAFFFIKIIKNAAFCKLAFFIPGLIGSIAAGCILQIFINAFIPILQISEFLAQYNDFLGFFALINWQLIGFITLIYVFAFANLRKDKNIINAAKLDGASFWQILLKLRLHSLIRPVIICALLTFIGAFRIVKRDIVFFGGSHAATFNAGDKFNFPFLYSGIAQAETIVFFVILSVFIFVLIKIIPKLNKGANL